VKNGQKVLISDLDGTLIWFSLPPSFQGLNYAWFIVPPLFPVLFLGYLLRPRKRSVKARICQQKREGGRVILATATKDNRLARGIIRSWLKVWRVPYDKLVLRPRGMEIVDFKAKVAEKEGADVFLEDNRHIAFMVREKIHQWDRDKAIRVLKEPGGIFLILIGEKY